MSDIIEKAFLQVNIGILVIDRDYMIVQCNHFVGDQTKKSRDNIIDHNLFSVYPNLPEKWLKRRIENILLLKNSSFISWEQRPSLFDFASSCPITGIHPKMVQNCSLLPIIDEQSQVTHICITINDVTTTAIGQIKLKKASQRLNEEKIAQQKLIGTLEETKGQLLQSEKMASIGQLAAGVAHEINNPVGYIKSNFNSLKHYASELNEAMSKYSQLIDMIESDEIQSKAQTINEEHDISFLTEDIINLLSESFDGVKRIEEIVKSLKHFSRADSHQWESANVNEGISSTLKVVAHELKYLAEVEENYGEVPLIECLPMQLNQVIMNLLVNAAHAIDPERNDGKVVIDTLCRQDQVIIKISDNGKGIEEKIVSEIFNPFFTTKPVGKGTGLGLSMSYSIIQKHSGSIDVSSELGKGTCFTVTLPIKQLEVDE